MSNPQAYCYRQGGFIFLRGEFVQINKIYNENCLDTMARMPDNFIDLTVTSPPYDNLRSYNGYSFDFESVAKELYRVTKQGGVVVWVVGDATIKGSETGTSFRQALYFKEIGFNLHDTMIWQKISPYQHHNRYIQCFEYMFIFSKGFLSHANLIQDRRNKWSGCQIHGTSRQVDGSIKRLSLTQTSKIVKNFGSRYNIWDIPPSKHHKTTHSAVFPEQLANDHIISWSNENDLVYDPFMGSGTTAKMAIKNNRQWVGSEISEEYCCIILDRIKNVKPDIDHQLNLFEQREVD
jgi:DNA modification methylase